MVILAVMVAAMVVAMVVSLSLTPHNSTVPHNTAQVLAAILATVVVVAAAAAVVTAAIMMAPPTQRHIRQEDTEVAAAEMVVVAIPMDLVVMEVRPEVAEVVTIPAAMVVAVVPTIHNLGAALKIEGILLEEAAAAVTVSFV